MIFSIRPSETASSRAASCSGTAASTSIRGTSTAVASSDGTVARRSGATQPGLRAIAAKVRAGAKKTPATRPSGESAPGATGSDEAAGFSIVSGRSLTLPLRRDLPSGDRRRRRRERLRAPASLAGRLGRRQVVDPDALPLEDVRDRIMVRRQRLPVDREGLELVDAREREVVRDLQDLERGRHPVLELLALRVEVAFGELARLLRRGDRARRRVDVARGGPHLDEHVLLEGGQPGLVRLPRVEGGAPLPLRAAVQDRIREPEADLPVLEVAVDDLLEGVA